MMPRNGSSTQKDSAADAASNSFCRYNRSRAKPPAQHKLSRRFAVRIFALCGVYRFSSNVPKDTGSGFSPCSIAGRKRFQKSLYRRRISLRFA